MSATYKCPECGEAHEYKPGQDFVCPNGGKRPKPSKYRAVKTQIDGHRFDSKKEAQVYEVLRQREEAGDISGLTLQPLIPVHINGELVCNYKADFAYFDKKRVLHVVDAKGMHTPVYRLKKKMVEADTGLRIEEV